MDSEDLYILFFLSQFPACKVFNAAVVCVASENIVKEGRNSRHIRTAVG